MLLCECSLFVFHVKEPIFSGYCHIIFVKCLSFVTTHKIDDRSPDSVCSIEISSYI